MRRRSGLPSLKSSRISGGACTSIVFRAAAAKNAQLHHAADKLCHFRLAIPHFGKKNVVLTYFILMQKLAQNATICLSGSGIQDLQNKYLQILALGGPGRHFLVGFVLRTVRRDCQVLIQTFRGPFAVACQVAIQNVMVTLTSSSGLGPTWQYDRSA
jgi:hypothetical protein